MQTLDDSLSARAWFGCLISAPARSPSPARPSPSATFVEARWQNFVTQVAVPSILSGRVWALSSVLAV